jgi:crossover junction endodeoxyribonuclease RuvC
LKTYIGLDPGKQGGIAWITPEGKACAVPMPDTLRDLWDVFADIVADAGECVAALENVSSSPQMGVVSSFTFGQGYGRLEMALTAAMIPYQRVTPGVWQKEMKCRTKGDKNVSKARAQELFPQIKITHAIADSLLIASYARLKL